jgi:uncharacterized protein YcnI
MTGVASAHVAVTSPDAVRAGELALVSFRVPTESAQASTVKVTITLPTDTPVAEVQVRPIPGWVSSVAERSLGSPTKVGDFTLTKVPASITWTAQAGSGVKPGQFQLFDITIAPVPDVTTMTFTATQVYSDGTVVRWDQEPAADGTEAEFPKPELALAAADAASPSPEASTSPSASDSQSATPTITVTASPVAAPSDSSSSSSPLALVVAIVAALLGSAALVVALRRPSARRESDEKSVA